MKILCIGDSLTYGMGVPRSGTWVSLAAGETGFCAVNRGICGDTSSGMLARFLTELQEHKPDVAMIMGGTNDFIAGGTPAQAAVNCMGMAAGAAEMGITPLLCAPPPCDVPHIAPQWGGPAAFSGIHQMLSDYGERLQRVTALFGTPFLNLYEAVQAAAPDRDTPLFLDGLHLSRAGHILLARLVVARWETL